jgi:hypothetical protein
MKRTSVAITFFAFFTASKTGKTGLTVTVDVYRKSSGTALVTAGSATALAGGLYYYDLASGSTSNADDYLAIFKTSDTTVDFQHVPSLQANVGLSGTPLPDAPPGETGGLPLHDALVEVGDDAVYISSVVDDISTELALKLDAEDYVPLDAEDVWSNPSRTLTGGPLVADDGQQYNARVIVQGDTYSSAARPFVVSIAQGASWPDDLSLYTWKYLATKAESNEEEGSDSVTADAEVINATGSNRSVRVILTGATTSAMAEGTYEHRVRGTLISDNSVFWSIETGTTEIKPGTPGT